MLTRSTPDLAFINSDPRNPIRVYVERTAGSAKMSPSRGSMPHEDVPHVFQMGFKVALGRVNRSCMGIVGGREGRAGREPGWGQCAHFDRGTGVDWREIGNEMSAHTRQRRGVGVHCHFWTQHGLVTLIFILDIIIDDVRLSPGTASNGVFLSPPLPLSRHPTVSSLLSSPPATAKRRPSKRTSTHA